LQSADLKRSALNAKTDQFEEGLSTANLGGHLFKVRVMREGSGKRSGYRTIIVFIRDDRAIFLYGFGKNERGNIDKSELNYFKKLGHDLLALNSSQLLKAINDKVLYDLEDTK
jgi:hypothetical protein